MRRTRSNRREQGWNKYGNIWIRRTRCNARSLMKQRIKKERKGVLVPLNGLSFILIDLSENLYNVMIPSR